GLCDHRDWKRGTGETRLLFARKFVISSVDPLHWGRARIHHGRADGDSRLGGPVLSRLVFAIDHSASPFHSASDTRFGTPVVDLEIWREAAADAASGQK